MEGRFVSDSKYSLLFMRDDSDVRRLRVSSFWLRAYLIFQGLLLVLGVLGVWLGVSFWLENRSLNAENHALSTRLEEAELKLSSLANMEKILEAYDKRDLQSLLNATEAKKSGEATPEAVPDREPVDLADLFETVDQGPISAEDLKTVVSNDRLVVTFRLENPSDTLASGVTHLAVITNDGQLVQVAPRENLSYQIQKRKFERATFDLPEGVNQDTLFAVRVEVKDSNGTTIFKKSYPLAGQSD